MMTYERQKFLLDSIVEHVSMVNSLIDAISELLSMGFYDDELIGEFNISEEDVRDAITGDDEEEGKEYYTEEVNGFIRTDDLQFQRKLKDRVYYMIGADEIVGIEFPKGVNYIVYRGEVRLDYYSGEQLADFIIPYYGTVENFVKCYPDEQERNGLIAECVFEALQWSEADDDIQVDTEKEAVEVINKWMKEY